MFAALAVAEDCGRQGGGWVRARRLSSSFALRQKHCEFCDKVGVGAEQTGNEGVDEVDGAMSGLVRVQHGQELFVDVGG